MPSFITVKTTDPPTPVYTVGTTDINTYLDPPSTGTYDTSHMTFDVDMDLYYSANGSGKRYLVGTRPHSSGH